MDNYDLAWLVTYTMGLSMYVYGYFTEQLDTFLFPALLLFVLSAIVALAGLAHVTYNVVQRMRGEE